MISSPTRFALSLFLVLTFRAHAGESPAAAWTDAARPLSIAEQGLAGPGADWITERAGECQFVLFGEAHGVAEIPMLVAAAHASLRAHGFEHLALEMGPWIAERLSAEGVDAVIERYPHGIAFDHDPELDLLRAALKGFQGTEDAVWGLDQTSTAVHPFERLAKIAPGLSAGRLARGAQLKASLKFGRYTRQPHGRDLQVLRTAFDPSPGDEADRILDAVTISQAIFVAHVSKQYAESIATREAYMMDRLREELATHGGETPTRVIFKFGGSHIMEGVGPNGVRTLGDEAQQIAEANGLDALHIGVWRWRGEAGPIPGSIFNVDGEDAPANFVLVDARALREEMGEADLAALPEDLRACVEQYDALILIREASGAAKTEIRAAQRAHRNRLLAQLSPMAIGLLGGLLPVIPIAAWGWRRIRRRPMCHECGPVWPWFATTVVTLGLMALLAVQVMAIRSAAAGRASLDAGAAVRIGVPVLFAAIGIGLLVLLVHSIRRGWWGRLSRIGLGATVLFLLIGVGEMWWWNIGAMLP